MMRPICDLSGKKQSAERVKNWNLRGSKSNHFKISSIDTRRRKKQVTSHRNVHRNLKKNSSPFGACFPPEKLAVMKFQYRKSECKT